MIDHRLNIYLMKIPVCGQEGDAQVNKDIKSRAIFGEAISGL